MGYSDPTPSHGKGRAERRADTLPCSTQVERRRLNLDSKAMLLSHEAARISSFASGDAPCLFSDRVSLALLHRVSILA